MRSAVGAALILITYLAGVNVFLTPVQLRVWNYLNGIDVLVMVALVAPFIATRWVSPSNLRATRVAWYLAAVMALDVVFFAIMTFAPIGGHPSLESVVLGFTGLLKVLLVPAALLALVIAFTNGERISTITLGLICMVCETVYIVPVPNHPFQWLLLRNWLKWVV
jgi:hypothetical protein